MRKALLLWIGLSLSTACWSRSSQDEELLYPDPQTGLQYILNISNIQQDAASSAPMPGPVSSSCYAGPQVCTAHFMEAMDASEARLRALPDWAGDATLRDATIAYFEAIRPFAEREILEYFIIDTKVEIRSEDFDRLDELFRRVMAAREPAMADLQASLRDFVLKHGVSPPPETDKPTDGSLQGTFVASSLPASTTVLPDAYRVVYATRYRELLVSDQGAMALAGANFFSALHQPHQDPEQARRLALEEVRAIRVRTEGRGDWQRDGDFRAANLAYADELIDILESSSRLGRMARSGARFGEDRRYTAMMDQTGERLSHLYTSWSDADAIWRQRWAIDEYVRWRESRGAVVAGPTP